MEPIHFVRAGEQNLPCRPAALLAEPDAAGHAHLRYNDVAAPDAKQDFDDARQAFEVTRKFDPALEGDGWHYVAQCPRKPAAKAPAGVTAPIPGVAAPVAGKP